MNKIEIPLGSVTVRFRGDEEDDSEWVKALNGDYPSVIDLSVGRFPRLDELTRGVVEEELFVVNYEEYFSNNDAVAKRLKRERYAPKSIAHLLAIKKQVPKLWEQHQIAYIEAGDPRSFWLSSDGYLCVPYRSCGRGLVYRGLSARWVGCSRYEVVWFLVGK